MTHDLASLPWRWSADEVRAIGSLAG